MRHLALSLAVTFVVSAAALAVMPTALAQPLAWEQVDQTLKIRDLYVHDDGAIWASGRGSALLGSDLRGLVVMRPGTDVWVNNAYDFATPDAVVLTEAGTILIQRGRVERSTDGGETFSVVHTGTDAPLYRVPSGPYAGRLLTKQTNDDLGAAYSTDDGVTWTDVPISPPDEDFGDPTAFLSVPEGPFAGRIVATCFNGVAYSDDGGESWALSGLWELFAYLGVSLAWVPGEHLGDAPQAGGRLFAGVSDPEATAGLWSSDDGGATWSRVRDFGDQVGYPLVVHVGGGRLFAVLTGEGGLVWRSDDGGATWAEVASLAEVTGATEEPFALARDLVLDAEGRLNVALVQAGPTAAPDGLWRTVLPVVASEQEPDAGEAFGVEVYPNPARGSATVALSVAERSEMSVAVYDVLGREVARVLHGAFEAGRHTAALDLAGLPSGVYVVRAVAADAAATQRITVLR